MPHVGETDTDTLTEIPGRPAEAEEENEEEEVEDEFGYSWSEFRFSISKGCNYTLYSVRNDRFCLGLFYIFVIGILDLKVAYHEQILALYTPESLP